ncbi:Cytochrome b561 [Trichoplax sp. H2]|uniref:Cytochrome b561 domain-containing protein n=1 Tax=Trichoplax adhaerens TaxID=10228 RepID=B3RQM2_TRIAD|nr:hypothetical protein TRIADDRAFT_23237 [Trichoplax adhaerens]EDV27273.1 hypothetical protein TRIADDRAFT_23237 [Trichoplax adhaerens]RDD42606.1 Cytochrome b561 [Trichoplax sp. H2]|eukprot:XP_002111269.1 hypothetical protein TRIADDRAFT_23237 [Trichoplax adhaerens]
MLERLQLRQSGTSTNLTERLWPFLVVASQTFGLLAFILLTIWVTKFLGGMLWDGGAKEFNVHPYCMVISMILLNGEAISFFRIFRHSSKNTVKLAHASIQLVAFTLATVGLSAVFQFHDNKGYPNAYSMHSWCGLLTVSLFGLQYVFGLVFFVLRFFHENLRQDYLKLHQFFGKIIFAMAIATSLIGIDEELTFAGKYGQLPPVASLGNVLGLVLIIFGIIVAYIITHTEFERPPSDDEFKAISETEND